MPFSFVKDATIILSPEVLKESKNISFKVTTRSTSANIRSEEQDGKYVLCDNTGSNSSYASEEESRLIFGFIFSKDVELLCNLPINYNIKLVADSAHKVIKGTSLLLFTLGFYDTLERRKNMSMMVIGSESTEFFVRGLQVLAQWMYKNNLKMPNIF